VPMGGVSPIPHRGEYVPVLVEWKSTDEFGPIQSIDLYVGVSSDSLDSGLVYAPAKHGVHSASTPAGTVDPHPYLDSAGGQHWQLLDGYMLDPLGTLRITPGAAEGKQGRRLVAIRANDYLVGWPRYTPSDPGGCTPNHDFCYHFPDNPTCEWECRDPRPASWDFNNPSLPDRMFVRAFARTVRQAGALCEPPGQQTAAGVIAQLSGRCTERLAFTNPVWVDNMTGPPPGDFDITCTPSILNLYDGNTSTCTVSSIGGFARPVHLGCARLPEPASCLFEPAIVTPPAGGTVTSTLTLSVGPIAAGTYAFQAQAARPGVTRTRLMQFIVGSVPGGDLTAAFDGAWQAPSCSTMIGRSCDSVRLVTGRGVGARLYAEPYPPSTIARSCNEAGSTARFPPERYVDRIKVSTSDGSPLERGKLVQIDADVAMLSDDAWGHAVDFFYTADAAHPVWTLIGTVVPYQTELHTVSAPYLLPAGDLQAVRVQIREGASSVPCAADTRADRDDLIFAVR
jgi:hypothetical protein